MSVEKVREYLKGYGVADRMQEFTVSSATVELAAVAVGVEPARIAKTLSFKVDETPILIVAAGDAKVDNSKYKHFFHTKAKMLTHEEAVERLGHAVALQIFSHLFNRHNFSSLRNFYALHTDAQAGAAIQCKQGPL